MSQVFEHNLGDHEDPLPGPTWTIGFLSVAILISTVFGLTAIYYTVQEEETVEKEIVPEIEALKKLREGQQARLIAEPHIEIRDAGGVEETAVVIPLDQAMELIVEEYGKK